MYYRAAHPEIAALVEAGHFAFGFDHFCRLGHRFLSGHWLFDETLYAGQYDDMALENLDCKRFHGRYDHYLRSGQHEHRLAHPLFDGKFYAVRAIAAGDDPRIIERTGPYAHFLYRLRMGAPELPPSIYFDPVWYAERHGHAGSALEHYLRGAECLDPVPEFSEAYYREIHPDVRAVLESRDFASGYRHFLQIGVFELRRPHPEIDLVFYRDANVTVRGDLNTGAVRDAFAHLRAIGIGAGLPCAPPPPDAAGGEAAAKQLFIARARDGLAAFARRRIDFTPSGACRLAVILVMFEKFELTMNALVSLRGSYGGDLQLILVDNGSTDATREIGHYVRGARIIRLDRNIGYLRACNLALEQVTAEFVLFLNNDVELGFGAVESAIARLGSAADIGAVGGKVVRSHGLLQEAGCIIWRDGSTAGYMRDASPLAGEANFVRDVDFCSGVFLLCRAALVKDLGGFDPQFSPAYYEEADLCLRMGQAGFRVVYDPAIVIHHLEYGSADSQAAQALMRRGRQKFMAKHAAFLKTRPPESLGNLQAARSPPRGQKRILFIEDIVPLRGLGSGYVRANDIVHAMANAGHAVSVFPVERGAFDVLSIYGAFPETVEILHDRDIGQLVEFLESRPGYYDLIWISRTHNLGRILPLCAQAGIDPEKLPFVLDTEAIAASRDAARAALGVEDFDFERKLREELEIARPCRHCIAVNDAEAGLLRRTGLQAISVLGTMRRPDPTPAAFAARDGLLFAAAIHRSDSPNLDALRWYAEEILPALETEMAEPPVLNVAGYVAPEIDLSRFAGHPKIRIHGPAMSLRYHYDSNRLFIAPTRFAAGTPYKLYETASYGLPCVATRLLAGQLNWRDGVELLTAPTCDAKSFAMQIARLYRSPAIWRRLRKNALARIALENSAEAFNARVCEILDAYSR